MNKKEFMKNWSWLVQLHVDVEELFKDVDQLISSTKTKERKRILKIMFKYQELYPKAMQDEIIRDKKEE